MKTIPLSKGKVAIVDDEDFDWLSKYKWCVSSWGYAVTKSSRKLGKQKTIYMHRLIMATSPEMEVDHIDGNRLDNRRHNLRNCVSEQNLVNRAIHKNNRSGYKGVDFHKSENKFRASIMFKGKRIVLGRFKTAAEAGAAYALAAKEIHGAFARIK